MIDNLIDYFNRFTSLDKNETTFLRDNIPIRDLDKNEVLLNQGDVSKEFYFIIQGCIRLFYQIETEEKTAFFYTENTFASSYQSFTKQTPSNHNLQSIEITRVAVISFDMAYKMLETFPKFEFLARVMMEEELIIYQDIISSFVTLSPEQRYLRLLETESALLQRIPQYHLATYLGVAPETLSRIRKRIVQ